MKLRKLFIAAMMLISIVAVAQQGMQMPPIPVDPDVRIGKLDNGLTYYIRHNAWPEHRAEFYIAQRVGSIQEDDNQRGLAHFLEHMAFNGSKHFKGNEMLRWCESVGVKFGTDLNAYTSIDQTVYNISNVPTTREGIVDSCLLILFDWADGLLLEQATQCDGIARGVQYLLTKAGVDCIFAAASYTGEVKPGTDPASYAGHAWNLVNIDGDWYELDATWSTPGYSDPNNGETNTHLTYSRLNLTTEEMRLGGHAYDLYNKKNTVESATRFDYPVCTATAANYYVREGLLFDSFDVSVVKSVIDRGVADHGYISIRFTNDALFDQAVRAIGNGSLSTEVRCTGLLNDTFRTIDLIPE